jgi:ligand-binding SRPBCC domain-containing protein
MPAPAFALRLVLGEAASAFLAGQRATPTRTLALGFHYRFATLSAALSDLFGGQDAPRFEPARALPDSPYLRRRGARTVLRQSTPVAAPPEQVFALYGRPANLGALSPASSDMRFENLPDAVDVGTEMAFTVKVGPTRRRWVSVIESWAPPVSFVDVQTRGPFAAWWHEHRVVRDGTGSRVEDTVYFKAPLGPLGRLAEALFVRRKLREMFELRAHAMRLRFGPATG